MTVNTILLGDVLYQVWHVITEPCELTLSTPSNYYYIHMFVVQEMAQK